MKKKLVYLCILLLIVLSTTACANTGGNLNAVKEELSAATESSTTTSEIVNSAAPNENTSSTTRNVSENIPDRQYSVGDIILNGGSALKADELTALSNDDLPVAVVAGVKDNGTFFAVGVFRSDEPLQWSNDTGNSPALDFISGYAESHGLTGDFASDWRMPDIAELQIIYDNREVINETLEKIHKSENSAMDGLSTTWYWSSTQSESQEDYAWFVHFYNGYAGECPKNFTNVNVIAVREL